MPKISLNKLVETYYNDMNYISTSFDKNNKQYLQVENINFAKNLIQNYNNLKLVYTYSEFAPEIKKVFITLK